MKRLTALSHKDDRFVFIILLATATMLPECAIAAPPMTVRPDQTGTLNQLISQVTPSPIRTSPATPSPIRTSPVTTSPNVIRSTPQSTPQSIPQSTSQSTSQSRSQPLLSQTGVLRREDRGPAVTDLQAQLAELGYYNGGLTEYFGELTERAVILFQQDMGLTADGVVGGTTSAAIRQELFRRRQAAIPPTSETTLQLNDAGEQVADLQRRLTTLGYYGGAISGLFDIGTEQAVILFQQQNNLAADGIVGASTRSMLLRPVSEVGYRDGESAGLTFGNRVLQLGDSGDDVAILQDRLRELGFYGGQTTGTFGVVTQTAVIAFQRSRGLLDDGIVGAAVYNALGQSGAIDPRRTR